MDEAGLAVRTAAGDTPDAANRMSLTQTRALTWRALTGAESYREAAEHAGVDESTVRYWMRTNGRFRALWATAGESAEQLVRELRAHGRLKSLSTLIAVQDKPDAPDSVRVDAASKFLTNDRQERQMEQPGAGTTLAEMLDRWAERARERQEEEARAIVGEVRALPEAGDA